MEQEKDFDFLGFIQRLETKRIPYLLIGRWAVILHGAPLMTADYDFWISPKSKKKLLDDLEDQGFEMPPHPARKSPILSVYWGAEKIDFFFFEKITNREGQTLTFNDCLRRADAKEDSRKRIRIRVPSLDDLIVLKKMKRNLLEDEMKDSSDLRFLEAIKRSRMPGWRQ